MYISNIKITNFRSFKLQTVVFNDGINVIIGHNNAGKTNLIKALSLVLDYKGNKRLDVDDFNKRIKLEELKDASPKITISLTISKGKESSEDDLATISTWLTKLEGEYEAKLTYEFFLPEKQEKAYQAAVAEVEDREQVWSVLRSDFIRMYSYKIWGGDIDNRSQADGESLKKIDFQFLNAIRDVERDMLTGRNVMLRDVLHFFLDYEIKNSKKNKEDRESQLKIKSSEFIEEAGKIIEKLRGRIDKGKDEILSYAKETGASFQNAIPDFDGEASDWEMLYFLKLLIKQSGIKIPASHNGLGYNNLIFISLLLAKMQANTDGNYLGGNAKVFSVLAIEEPEAHLHPSMQHKFLKFLKENKEKRKVRQIFITSHSTHITSAVELDEIICLYQADEQDSNNKYSSTAVGYPGKVFSDTEEGKKSKKYVQRFLDATKSDMLFAQRILLVEGIAEQLLFPVFARCIGKSLENQHVTIINVGGRYFDHFLKLFDSKASKFSINKKIACVTDRDPKRKRKESKEKSKKCYPFEIIESAEYEYASHSEKFVEKYKDHKNIRFFSQDAQKGKTLEYDLIRCNHDASWLITDSMANKEELNKMMTEGTTFADVKEYLKGGEEKRITDGVEGCDWSEEEKMKAVIAARYLNSVGKGENALELAYKLDKNLQSEEKKEFVVPPYIIDAIEWICK